MLRLLRVPLTAAAARCVSALPATPIMPLRSASTAAAPSGPGDRGDDSDEFEFFEDDLFFLSELFDEGAGDLFNFIPAEDRRLLDLE